MSHDLLHQEGGMCRYLINRGTVWRDVLQCVTESGLGRERPNRLVMSVLGVGRGASAAGHEVDWWSSLDHDGAPPAEGYSNAMRCSGYNRPRVFRIARKRNF